MKYCLFILLYFFFGFKATSQTSLQTFIEVYNKNSITEAKKSFRAIQDFQLVDSLRTDSLIGSINEGNIKGYVKHNKTNIQFFFTEEKLYKSLYTQAEKYFKYTFDYARGTRGNGTSRHTTSFSNYEGAKIGSLEVLLIVVSSTETEKVIRYELLLFPYHED